MKDLNEIHAGCVGFVFEKVLPGQLQADIGDDSLASSCSKIFGKTQCSVEGQHLLSFQRRRYSHAIHLKGEK